MTGGVSRRELLAGIGMAGAAIGSSAVGHSTASAFLSDADEFAGNVTTSGEVDLEITSDVYYNDEPITDLGIPEIKPGDSGRFVFRPEILGNPSYLWLCGAVTRNAEVDKPESEGETIDGDNAMPTDGPGGELGEAMTTELAYVPPDKNGDRLPISTGSFEDVLGRLRHGVALDAEALNRDAVGDPGDRACFQGSDGPCVELQWEVPDDGNLNNIVTDELEFEFTFHAQQCRHNDGKQNPCPQGISSVSFCIDDQAEPTDAAVSSLTVTEWNASGEPTAVDFDWSSEETLRTVVLYYSGVFENFQVDGNLDTEIAVGLGDERLHFNRNGEYNPAGVNDQWPEDPCPEGQTGLKYDYVRGGFDLDS